MVLRDRYVRVSVLLLLGLVLFGSRPSAAQTVNVVYGASRLPLAAGEPVTFLALVDGLDGALEYQVWRLGPDGWHSQPYTTSPNYSWTPNAADVGTHLVQVWVRRIGSAAAYEAWGATPSFEVTPARPPSVSLLASTPAPVAGTPVTWSAVVEGGVGPFEFRFLRLDRDGWKDVQSYGPSNTYQWTPGMADVGSHSLQVWIRRVGSAAAYEAWAGSAPFTVEAPPPPQVSLAVSNTVPPRVGAATTWTAVASGGLGPLEYRFMRLDGGAWHEVQPYGPSNSFTWTPGTSAVGEHVLQVWVRSVGSRAAYDVWAGTGWFIVAPAPVLTITAVTVDVPFPARVGVPMTFTAATAWGAGPLEYRFIRNYGGRWTEVQGYSTSNTHTWVPTESDAGMHSLQVWVRHVGSSAPYDAWLGTNGLEIRVDPALSLRASVPGDVAVGGSSIWIAEAPGLTDPEFEFRRWDPEFGRWSVVRPYGPGNVYFWIPSPADVGSRAIGVRVRPRGASLEFSAEAHGPSFAVTPLIPVRLSMQPRGTVAVGEPVTVGAASPPFPILLEYQFWRHDPAGNWILLQDFTATSTHTWRPGVADIGTHAVQLFVRVPGSADAYQGWAGTAPFEVVCPASGAVTLSADMYRPEGTGDRAFGFTGVPVKLTARACGLGGDLEYQFLRVTDGAAAEIRGYGRDNTLEWTSTSPAMDVTIEVRVRRVGAPVIYDQRASTSFDMLPPSEDRSVQILTAPFTARVGQSVTVSDTTSNVGPAPTLSGCTNTYMLNATIVGKRVVPGLFPGDSDSGSVTFSVPALPPGSYWLFVYTDCRDVPSGNNMRWIGVRITP